MQVLNLGEVEVTVFEAAGEWVAWVQAAGAVARGSVRGLAIRQVLAVVNPPTIVG